MEAGLHFCSMYVGRTGNHLIIYYLKRRENEEMDHKKKKQILSQILNHPAAISSRSNQQSGPFSRLEFDGFFPNYTV
jgi:hypothetical protein